MTAEAPRLPSMVVFSMGWEWLVSATCPPNGRASARCSASPRGSLHIGTSRSASGKRDSSPQRQTSRNRGCVRNRLRRDRNAGAKARQWRAFWQSPGNLTVRKSAWWAREDSNLQPDRYEQPGSHCGFGSREPGVEGGRQTPKAQHLVTRGRRRNGSYQSCRPVSSIAIIHPMSKESFETLRSRIATTRNSSLV